MHVYEIITVMTQLPSIMFIWGYFMGIRIRINITGLGLYFSQDHIHNAKLKPDISELGLFYLSTLSVRAVQATLFQRC